MKRYLFAVAAVLLLTVKSVAAQTPILHQSTTYAFEEAAVTLAVGQTDACADTRDDGVVGVNVPYQVIAKMGADTKSFSVLVGSGTTGTLSPVVSNQTTAPDACVVVSVTAKTAGTYRVQVVARNTDPANATNFTETPSVIKTIAAQLPPVPKPGVPTFVIRGSLTVAGRVVPAEFNVTSIAAVIGQ